jgi:hypothetical protein
MIASISVPIDANAALDRAREPYTVEPMKISISQTETLTVIKKRRCQLEIEAAIPIGVLIRRIWRTIINLFS